MGRRQERCLFRGSRFRLRVRPHAFLDVDRRWDYGEDRYRLPGAVEGRMFVVIYTAGLNDPHHFGPQGQPQRGSGI